MRKLILALAVIVSAAVVTTRAQDTNGLRTVIENFESQTNVIMVRGFGVVGSVSIGNGIISVRSKESININLGQKAYGVVIELGGEALPRQRAVIDEDELESLLGGLDYLRTITADVTAMPAFEAHYDTKDGLRFLALGSRRQSGIQYFLRFEDGARFDLNSDELTQIRNLVSQARNAINSLKGAK